MSSVAGFNQPPKRVSYYYVDDDDDTQSMLTQENHHFGDDKGSLVETLSQLSLGSAHTGGTTETYKKVAVPEHACNYCLVHEPASVVKCLGCQRWFCNGRGGGGVTAPLTSGSHILHHLVRSKHRECMLHPDSPIGDAILECYACGCRNVFVLGFVPTQGDSVVVLLCRHPCVQATSKDADWDAMSWTPLIQDKMLLEWLVARPSEHELSRARPVTMNQIVALEELWKKYPEAGLEAVEMRQQQEDALPQTQLVYEGGAEQYKEIFLPLVNLEAEYDRELKEAQVLENVTIRWDVGLNQQKLAWFMLSTNSSQDADFRVAPGDVVEITLPHRNWKAEGFVLKVPGSAITEELCVEIRTESFGHKQGKGSDKNQPEMLDKIGFKVQFVWKPTPYERMRTALNILSTHEDCVGPFVFQRLMGVEGEQPNLPTSHSSGNLSAPNLPSLNHSQAHAVRSALQRPFSLIQGPPGTGKTVTTATLVHRLVKEGRGPILVCAPSNVAVDHLTEKIHATGLKVVRLAARWREAIDNKVSFLTLSEQVDALTTRPEYTKLLLLKREQGELSSADQQRFNQLRVQSERQILDAAEVVLSTCVGAGSKLLSKRIFGTVIIDEATQASEPESLIPLVHGAEQVILVGDHRQLGPVVMNKRAARAGLKVSLFERLIALGIRPIRLQVQYRMHPSLSAFPSNAFYDGSLQNGVSDIERTRPEIDFKWPDPSNPMFFLIHYGNEEVSPSGTSFLNRSEAVTVERAVTMFMKAGVLPQSIGVITPYEGQRAYILQHMVMNGSMPKELYSEIEVASVDAFQGREKDYIILSCVRSNEHQGIGFLSDARRLNVALTRARYGLAIFGNARVLSTNHLWASLLSHFQEKNLLMDGTINSMRPSTINLSARQKDVPPLSQDKSMSRRDSLVSIGAAAYGISEEAFLTDDETASQLTQDFY